MSHWSFNPKMSFLGSSFTNTHIHTHTHRQTDWQTEWLLGAGFQDFSFNLSSRICPILLCENCAVSSSFHGLFIKEISWWSKFWLVKSNLYHRHYFIGHKLGWIDRITILSCYRQLLALGQFSWYQGLLAYFHTLFLNHFSWKKHIKMIGHVNSKIPKNIFYYSYYFH